MTDEPIIYRVFLKDGAPVTGSAPTVQGAKMRARHRVIVLKERVLYAAVYDGEHEVARLEDTLHGKFTCQVKWKKS